MQVSIGVGGAASGRRRDFDEQVEFVQEAEKLGVDQVWTAEAWGQDAIAPLAFLAARTERIRLGTGIMQVTARTPVMTAMTALTMAAISGDRFILGLGNSGPQVVEGLHGVPFAHPLGRMKEAIAIIRLALAGEKIAFRGAHYELPRPGGQGKAIRLAQPANPTLPIYLATLGPKALEFTGAEADGWVGTSFTPEHADAHIEHLERGATSAGRTLASLDIQAGGVVAFGDDLDALVAPLKPGMAFTLGAMGSPTTNFYNDAYRRGGWNQAAREVQQLWVSGRRDEAAAKVPAQMVVEANLLGTEADVAARVVAYRDAGVRTLRVAPAGATVAARLDTLGRLMEIVNRV